ncbi:MAG: ribosome recycling factor [SAR202 cluster bacterium]|nr:ribosome recycling factor [SAR202 cluster bacterium]
MTPKGSEDGLTLDQVLQDANRRMAQAVEHLKRELNSVRTGRATPSLVESVLVDYYGAPTPMNQLSTITAPEAQLLVIQPWDRQAIKDIEKAIQKSSLGLNPSNDGVIVRVPIPPLSQERRQDLVKSLGRTVEESRVAVRNVRRDAVDKVRGMERGKQASQDESKRSQDQLQKMTDNHIASIEQVWNAKTADLMRV